MKYIRILKVPEVKFVQGKLKITTVVTIVSDLHDKFLQVPINLAVSLLKCKDSEKLHFHQWEVPYTARYPDEKLELEIPESVYKRLHQFNDYDQSDPGLASLCIHAPGTDGSAFGDTIGSIKGKGVLPPIVSAWVDFCVISKDARSTTAEPLLRREFCSLDGPQLEVWERIGDYMAGHIWDAGLVLAAYVDHLIIARPGHLAQDFSKMKLLNVIELGCGCGIVSKHFASLVSRSKVVATDYSSIEERNLRIADSQSLLEFVELDWSTVPDAGDRPSQRQRSWPPSLDKRLDRTWDMILISDCTYNWDSFADLVRTISWLSKPSRKHIAIVVASKKRDDRESEFFNLMRSNGFRIANAVRIPMPKAEPEEDEVENTDIFVFKHASATDFASAAPEAAAASPIGHLWRVAWDVKDSRCAEIKKDRGIPDNA
ncbi:hypothetical protein NA57DRAFT_76187 [Rhizodiscina lignyota]|uniref:Uncharacterized protein n=1 Tax=Rhizodiscina lignyota TaxID=1504668 RepID=A0A9P4IDQ8_9PEZI|nr:hypothetical protein NA57DRAFT_76187 [Rhizodiscina lignyota]